MVAGGAPVIGIAVATFTGMVVLAANAPPATLRVVMLASLEVAVTDEHSGIVNSLSDKTTSLKDTSRVLKAATAGRTGILDGHKARHGTGKGACTE